MELFMGAPTYATENTLFLAMCGCFHDFIAYELCVYTTQN